MNALAFLLDAYASSNRASAEILRLRATARAFQVVKTWSKGEVIDILCAELLSNWLSVEQIAELQNFLSIYPFERSRVVPMTWSLCEAKAVNWKLSFETLKLWGRASCPDMGKDDTWYGWVPITWPSYVVQLRWNILSATARSTNSTIKIAPGRRGLNDIKFKKKYLKIFRIKLFSNFNLRVL